MLLLTWPAGLAALSALVFLPHIRRQSLAWITAVYVAMVGALMTTYPANRPGLGNADAGAYLASVVAVISGAVSWHWGQDKSGSSFEKSLKSTAEHL